MSCCRPLTTATAPAGTIEYVRFTLAHTRVAPNVRGVLAVAPVCMHAPSIDMMSTLCMLRVIRSGKVNTYLRVLGEHIISCRS